MTQRGAVDVRALEAEAMMLFLDWSLLCFHFHYQIHFSIQAWDIFEKNSKSDSEE